METVNDIEEVELLEDMFKDRFTEKDSAYMELKSKSLSHPKVIYPWKIKKQWNKNWNYTDRRDQDRGRYNDRNHHRGNSYSDYRDRSNNGEGSRYRDRSNDGEGSRYRDRSNDGEGSRYRDRSNDGEGSRYRDRSNDHRNSYNRDDRR